MTKKISNIYHIHDACCKHATNDVSNLNKLAVKYKYQCLYFTEHAPLKNNKILKRPSESEIANLKQKIKQMYGVKAYFGYELEFNKINKQQFLSFKNDNLPEFLIFGNHFYGNMYSPNWRLVYSKTKTIKDLLEYYQNYRLALKSKMFSWVAHPDIWLSSYQKWNIFSKLLTRQIVNLAIKYDIPLGFNANGLYVKKDQFHYPTDKFWKTVCKKPVKVIIEADSHTPNIIDPKWLNKTYDRAIQFGLENNLIDKVKINWLHIDHNQLKLIIINPKNSLIINNQLDECVWKIFANKYNLKFNLNIFKTLNRLDLKLAIIKIIEISRRLEKWDDEAITSLVLDWQAMQLKELKKNFNYYINKAFLNLLDEAIKNNLFIALIGDQAINQVLVSKLKLKNYYISNNAQIKKTFPIIDPYYESLAHFDVADSNAIVITNDRWQQSLVEFYDLLCLSNNKPKVKNEKIINLDEKNFSFQYLKKLLENSNKILKK